MTKIKKLVYVGLFGVLFINGCGGNSNHSIKDESNLESNVVSSAIEKIKLDGVSEGVAIDKIEVKIESKNGEDVVKTIIPEETGFKYGNGELLDNPPIITISQEESMEKRAKDGKFEVVDIQKVEISLKDVDGKKVIPSNPINVTFKAPKEAKLGDKIKIDIPYGVDLKGNSVLNKVTDTVVQDNGYISTTISSETFENTNLVVIEAQKTLLSNIVDGAAGN